MDFGKVSPEKIDHINFQLPPDHPVTTQVLEAAPTPNEFRAYVGCPVWHEKSWFGKIYPFGLKEKEALPHYTEQFNTIELNTTHYQIPSDETIERWKKAATPGFTYCPKFPQVISHEKELLNAEEATAYFCQQILKLGEHLGISFLQMGPAYTPQKGKGLVEFFKQIPSGLSIAIEFRHADWFNQPRIWARTCEVVAEAGHALVITDVSGRRDVLHQSLTIPKAVLRFVGNELHPTDYSRTDAWIERLKTWKEAGLEEVYAFIHCGQSECAPELAAYWVEQFNTHLKTDLKPPRFLPKVDQMELF
ncbi:DUF72 domain-containing protein [Siphonobacter sp. SORGH_AS_1065]|uniref:DUF72 domain-containing protein n=1 Tax=Siphonobacter sp. SORGH_AS_1065 TaxID=3041795 RepID=UPI0027856850|nr:DUF72 domain-containing protein [Siphonobacter sp. SORGH_AS_1065]MDQ1086739.1 uncharacterized protein YecE (DUF72 family) [Siphonobacter sp. SORGH_AS_1065]